MSMTGTLCRASDEEVSRLLAHPEEVGAFLYPVFVSGEGEGGRVASASPPGEVGADGEASAGTPAELDIDKAWHGIHYVLTGSDWEGAPPLNFLVTGGTEVGEEDLGYGPARAFTSAQVRAIHEALLHITPEQFARRVDPAALAEADIYPDVWDRRDEEDENRQLLTHNYAALRRYVEALARDGQGMVVYIG